LPIWLITQTCCNDFTIIFDANNLNEWWRAGEGKFLTLREEKGKEEQSIILQSEEEWDYYGMQRKCMTILFE
jgi:hypothetical protein